MPAFYFNWDTSQVNSTFKKHFFGVGGGGAVATCKRTRAISLSFTKKDKVRGQRCVLESRCEA